MFTKENWYEIKRVIQIINNKKLYMICMFISCLAYTLHQVLSALVNMYILNAVVDQEMSQLYTAFILLAVIMVISCVVDPIVTYIFNLKIGQSIMQLRLNVFKHIEKLSVSYLEKKKPGDLISITTNDINAISTLFENQVYSLLVTILYGIGSAVTMFLLDWRFFIIVIVLGAFSTIINTVFSPAFRRIGDRVQAKLANTTQLSFDIILGLRNIKIFGIKERIFEKYTKANQSLVDDEIKRGRYAGGLAVINFFISAINILGVLGIGMYMFHFGTLELGTIIAVINLQNGITLMFQRVGRFIVFIQGSLAASTRVFDLLETPVEEFPSSADIQLKKSAGHSVKGIIDLRDVEFGYDSNSPVINRISLAVQKGEKVALVGPSGGGKSTLLRLIMGLYPIRGGSIFIDGNLLCEETKNELRGKLAYVPQDSFLFDDTIYNNILFGRLNATENEIIEAAKKANAHDFIMALPDGYQTRIGENASKISTGQKQRIAIARAFLRDAPVILLDEPTASLDSINEKLVKQAISTLMEGKTAIIIAHQLSTIQNVDRVCTIENGQLLSAPFVPNDNSIMDNQIGE